MPVLSPHRSSASSLAGSYRSTFSSSGLDRPYYSSSYSPRITSYSERYTSRSYTDADGSRIYSRSGSITEDGVTTRYREESRENSVRRDSISRDSGISSIRENSILDVPRRDSSVSRSDRSDLSSLSVAETVAEFRNRYSPANYIPACQRKNDNVTRSKSINDIGLPPIERSDSKILKKKVNTPVYNNQLSFSINNTNNINNDNGLKEDDNGNRTSVAEMCKKFDKKMTNKTVAKKSVDKKQNDKDTSQSDAKSDRISENDSKFSEEENAGELEGSDELELNRNHNHTSNFASFIPSKDYRKGDSVLQRESVSGSDEGLEEDIGRGLVRGGHCYQPKNDISASPRLTRNALPQAGASTSSSPSNSVVTNNSYGLERDRGGGSYEDDLDRANGVKQLGLKGLKNIGNTCFMNSVIQCLSNTKLLLEYVRKDGYLGDINPTVSSMKGSLIKAFAQVIKELWSDDSLDRVVNTVSLKSQIQRFAPRFMGYAQQDAQEFLRYLLEGLHEDVNRVTERPKPIITEIDEKLSDSEKAAEAWHRYLRMDNSRIVDIFVGQLKSTLRCTHCGHCSVTFDPFWDLSLPIPQRTGQLRLSQCLDHFTKEETLDGDEKPTCSKCKERRRCTKSFSIQKFPKILVIHLKRFSPTERFRGKLGVTVDFPREGLDLRNYAADGPSECRYNLYAVSNHSGTTYSGHYTAYCRHPYSQSWHEYNDSRVSSISPRNIVSGEAYVLFYELESQKSHL